MKPLHDLFGSKEDLHPDLTEYIDTLPSFGQSIRHPLVYAVPYLQQLNALYNAQLAAKIKHRDKSLRDQKWPSYIFIHERPWRLHAFTQIMEQLEDDDYWKLLADIWIDSENIWQNLDSWTFLFAHRKNPHAMMDADDLKLFEQLSDSSSILIFRGCKAHNREGLSWSLKRDVAEKFAERFDVEQDHMIAIGYCSKKDIISLFVGRNESEIVVLPEHVH